MKWPFSRRRPVIVGMIHLPPLPGSPSYGGRMEAVRQRALRDARTLLAGGVDGLLIENFGDQPFVPEGVEPATIAAMSAVSAEIVRLTSLPCGINLLRNDARAALAVAVATGAAFIRVNVHVGAALAGEGMLTGRSGETLRDRARLRAGSVAIWADIDVKHASSLVARPLDERVNDTAVRGQADALIVSGLRTGSPLDMNHLRAVKAAAGRTPVLAGSGVTPANVRAILAIADGAIVGTALKRGGRTGAPVELRRVRALMSPVRRMR